MTVPARLDSLVLTRLGTFRHGCHADAAVSESKRQFLAGVWLAATVVLGAGCVLLSLAMPAWTVGAVSALITAVPGSMAILRGVVDAVSPRGKLPKCTTNTVTWLICYIVAAVGFAVAFVA